MILGVCVVCMPQRLRNKAKMEVVKEKKKKKGKRYRQAEMTCHASFSLVIEDRCHLTTRAGDLKELEPPGSTGLGSGCVVQSLAF